MYMGIIHDLKTGEVLFQDWVAGDEEFRTVASRFLQENNISPDNVRLDAQIIIGYPDNFILKIGDTYGMQANTFNPMQWYRKTECEKFIDECVEAGRFKREDVEIVQLKDYLGDKPTIDGTYRMLYWNVGRNEKTGEFVFPSEEDAKNMERMRFVGSDFVGALTDEGKEHFKDIFGEDYLKPKEWTFEVAAQIAAGVKLTDLKYAE